uniref:Uncharacterized protein n=1 Tax=Setaria viridis TaxID=4556 RepID=A0A4U6VCZ1_SETVI|nr:hypothetical protein SEVIR_3G250766v2 [Setaria viridis]
MVVKCRLVVLLCCHLGIDHLPGGLILLKMSRTMNLVALVLDYVRH